MAKGPKTVKTKASVAAFIASLADETRRKDAKVVAKLLQEVTGQKATMWGEAIVGYGEYEGPTGMWPKIAFSPRKASLVVYLMGGAKKFPALIKKLGKHKIGGSCLYITNLAYVDEAVLRVLAAKSYELMNDKYG